MKSLVFWGDGPRALAQKRHAEGARFVLWNEDRQEQLQGVLHRTLSSYLADEETDRLDLVAIAWTKAWGRRALLDGRSFRELLEWKGVSLWWWAELYLYHCTEVPRYVRLIEMFNRVLEAEAPDEVEVVGLPVEEALLLGRTCTAWRVLFHGPVRRTLRPGWPRVWRRSWASRVNTFKTLLSTVKAAFMKRPRQDGDGETTAERRKLLFLSHAAFWREKHDPHSGETHSYEHYFDRIIPETARLSGLEPAVVAVGPRAAFRRRGLKDQLGEWARLDHASGGYEPINRYTSPRVFRETLAGTRYVRAVWSRLKDSPGLSDSLVHSGVSFADLAGPDMAGTFLLQLPWAVRCYEETLEVLRNLRPRALCLYAESSGWGRAALAAARAEGVPSVAVQHGILYPTYYSYLHEPDETGCPRPDRTAVFGTAARDFLVERGGYAPESLVLTGSPKFDDLVSTAGRRDRDALRARWDVSGDTKLVVLAGRFKAIRPTHRALGPVLARFVQALESLPGVRCVVKPHPAEPAAPYEQVLRGLQVVHSRVISPGADLLELLHGADALVTVESLSAVEALALGLPVIVLNMPSNLREIVDAEAALGVPAGDDPGAALWGALFDEETRARLEEARKRYLSAVAGGLDGQATARIVELLQQAASESAASER